jgi:sigma-E factor negative regulatory protein RseA
MKDQLSALVDGEFAAEDAEHLITSLKSNGELKEAWQHYHLIGDAMRGNMAMRPDFSARVMQALDAEPTVLAVSKANKPETTPIKPSRYKSTRFWSMAASVAAVLFVGLVVLQQKFSNDEMAPVEIAQSLPIEYLEAHHAAAPSGSTYYIQTASYTEHR